MRETVKFYTELDENGNGVLSCCVTAAMVKEWFKFEKPDQCLEAFCPTWSLKEISPATEEHDAEWAYLPEGEATQRSMNDEEVFTAYCNFINCHTSNTCSCVDAE